MVKIPEWLRRAIIRNYQKLGYSANKALEEEKSKGRGMRRTDWLRLWREELGVSKNIDKFKYTRMDRTFRPDVFKVLKQPFGYMYTVKVDVQSESKGKYSRFVNIKVNNLLTKGEIIRRAIELFNKMWLSKEEYDEEDLVNMETDKIVELTVVDVYKGHLL